MNRVSIRVLFDGFKRGLLVAFGLVAVCAGVAGFSLAAGAGEVTGAEIGREDAFPYIIQFEGPDYHRPFFVAGTHALGEDGRLIGEYFTSPETIEEWMSTDPKGDCVQLRWSHSAIEGNPEGRKDFSSTVHQAENVVMARVVGSIGGFGAGIPGRLIRFEVEQLLKGSLPPQEHFFFPLGEVQVGNVCLSRVGDRYFGELPEIGDRVMLFYQTNAALLGHSVLHVGWSSGVVTIKDGSVAKLPRLFREKNASLLGMSADQLILSINQLVGTEVAQ